MILKSIFVVLTFTSANLALAKGIQCLNGSPYGDGVFGIAFEEIEPGKLEITHLSGTEHRFVVTSQRIIEAECHFSQEDFFLVDCKYGGVDHGIFVIRQQRWEQDFGFVRNSEQLREYYPFQRCKLL